MAFDFNKKIDFKQLAKERLANGSSTVSPNNKLDLVVFEYLNSVNDISSVYQLTTYLKARVLRQLKPKLRRYVEY